jgi:hypothetical protein
LSTSTDDLDDDGGCGSATLRGGDHGSAACRFVCRDDAANEGASDLWKKVKRCLTPYTLAAVAGAR